MITVKPSAIGKFCFANSTNAKFRTAALPADQSKTWMSERLQALNLSFVNNSCDLEKR